MIWNKNKCGSPGLAKYRPNKIHENLLLFTNESGAVYNPIMEEGDPYVRKSEKFLKEISDKLKKEKKEELEKIYNNIFEENKNGIH